MDKKDLAKQIVELLGGRANINSLDHCSTRLRFEIKDESVSNKAELERLSGVVGVISRGKQLQVVIGNNVGMVFKEIQALIGDALNGSEPVKDENSNLIQKALQTISGIFVPIIPAIAGAGMIKALLSILVSTSLIDTAGHTYFVLSFMSDAPFYFLPFLLAYTSARRFKCNPVLAMCIAGMFLHPNFIQARMDETSLSIFGAPIVMAQYNSTVIPIILTVWVMSYVEKFAERFTPSAIKAVFKPLLILFVTGILALVVIGPLGTMVGNVMAMGIEVLNGTAPWLIPLVTGAFAPLLVMTGMHYTLVPFTTIQLTNMSHEIVMGPGFLASNMAQSAVSFGVALRTKNKEMRQIAISTGITALMGITEPAMYGVTLKVKKALIAVILGGGAGGVYAGLSGLVRYAFGTPGLATLPVFIGENPMNIIHAIITIAISYFVALLAVFILKVGTDEMEMAEENTAIEVTAPVTSPEVSAARISIEKPVEGIEIDLSTIEDEVFAKEVLGPTKAYLPKDGVIYAPFEGEVSMIFPTSHAIGLRSDEGVEMLIHIGIDTVSLNGKGFKALVKEADTFKKGDPLIEFDIAAIEQAMLNPTVLVVITNSTDFIDIRPLSNDDRAFSIV